MPRLLRIPSLSQTPHGELTQDCEESVMIDKIIVVTNKAPPLWANSPQTYNGADITFIHTIGDRFIATTTPRQTIEQTIEAS